MSHRPPSLLPEDVPPPEPGDPAPVKHRMGHTRAFTEANPVSEDADPNDVHALCKINRDQEDAHEKVMRAVDRSAKRRHWRDYALIILLGNGLFAGIALLLPGAILFAGAGMLMLTLSVTWIYGFVLDPR